MIFSKLEDRHHTLEIARNMKQNGISDELITRCTGLPLKTITDL